MIKTPPSGFTVRPPHQEDLEAITELLYQRAGMHIVRQRDRYEKELRAGRELSTQTVEG